MKKNNEPKVGVLGAGAWGTTIAQLLSKNNSASVAALSLLISNTPLVP